MKRVNKIVKLINTNNQKLETLLTETKKTKNDLLIVKDDIKDIRAEINNKK